MNELNLFGEPQASPELRLRVEFELDFNRSAIHAKGWIEPRKDWMSDDLTYVEIDTSTVETSGDYGNKTLDDYVAALLLEKEGDKFFAVLLEGEYEVLG